MPVSYIDGKVGSRGVQKTTVPGKVSCARYGRSKVGFLVKNEFRRTCLCHISMERSDQGEFKKPRFLERSPARDMAGQRLGFWRKMNFAEHACVIYRWKGLIKGD